MKDLEYFDSSFSGFNKKTGYCEKDFLIHEPAWEGQYDFDADMYDKVSADIVSVLGDKKIYTGQEAYMYLHKRYFAFPIDYRQIFNYANVEHVNFNAFTKSEFDDDGALDKFMGEVGNYYSYLKDGRLTDEETITAVIDVSNEILRERFPEVGKYFDDKEKRLIDKYGPFQKLHNGVWGYFCRDKDGKIIPHCGGHSNIIVVIGSFDGKTVNSMNVLQEDGFIKELGYVVEFFRTHS